MKRKKIKIVEVDRNMNVAFSDEGHIFPVENYLDEDENPCLPEEALYACIKTGQLHYKIYKFETEEDYI